MSDDPWKQWLLRARSNLSRAKLGKQADDILYEDLCFDAQQAAEKALKALLLYLHLDCPRTHFIGQLLSLLESSRNVAIAEEIKAAAVLTDYAVTTRYPGDWEAIDAEEYQQALKHAERIWEWVAEEMAQVASIDMPVPKSEKQQER